MLCKNDEVGLRLNLTSLSMQQLIKIKLTRITIRNVTIDIYIVFLYLKKNIAITHQIIDPPLLPRPVSMLIFYHQCIIVSFRPSTSTPCFYILKGFVMLYVPVF